MSFIGMLAILAAVGFTEATICRVDSDCLSDECCYMQNDIGVCERYALYDERCDANSSNHCGCVPHMGCYPMYHATYHAVDLIPTPIPIGKKRRAIMNPVPVYVYDYSICSPFPIPS